MKKLITILFLVVSIFAGTATYLGAFERNSVPASTGKKWITSGSKKIK